MRLHSARRDRRWLAWILAAAAAGLWPAAPVSADSRDASEATYDVTFQGTWTDASTPGGVVGSAHFTTLIGAVHNDGVTFWRRGETATPGVELVAETGETARLVSEIEATPHAAAVIRHGIGQGGTSSATFSVEVTDDHPLVTLLSMIGPSPDWFVGVSSVALQDAAGRWMSHRVLDLYPYDAGTEDGDDFSLNHPPSIPQDVIIGMRGMGRFSEQPMARLTFELREAAGR